MFHDFRHQQPLSLKCMSVLCELLISTVSHPTCQGLREDLSDAQMLGVTLLQEGLAAGHPRVIGAPDSAVSISRLISHSAPC